MELNQQTSFEINQHMNEETVIHIIMNRINDIIYIYIVQYL